MTIEATEQTQQDFQPQYPQLEDFLSKRHINELQIQPLEVEGEEATRMWTFTANYRTYYISFVFKRSIEFDDDEPRWLYCLYYCNSDKPKKSTEWKEIIKFDTGVSSPSLYIHIRKVLTEHENMNLKLQLAAWQAAVKKQQNISANYNQPSRRVYDDAYNQAKTALSKQ